MRGQDYLRAKETMTAEQLAELFPFKAEVQADSTGTWAGNGLRFATVEEAWHYVNDLFIRWTAVREYRVVDDSGKVHRESGK